MCKVCMKTQKTKEFDSDLIKVDENEEERKLKQAARNKAKDCCNKAKSFILSGQYRHAKEL